MPDPTPEQLSVEQMYGDWGVDDDAVIALMDVSSNPRPRTSIYDHLAAAGIGDQSYVLDIGGRDGAQALDIAERFGCRVLSVDPVQYNLDVGAAEIASHSHGHLVEHVLGTIGEIPADAGTFDAVFARDMLGHVADLVGGFRECHRVLKPGGVMVLHDVFATPMLEPVETTRLCNDLAQVRDNLDPTHFAESLSAGGFKVELIEHIGSEWLEATLEADTCERRLLRAARCHRDQDRLRQEMGEIPFRVMSANTIWTIYRMIGKLEDRVYVLRRD